MIPITRTEFLQFLYRHNACEQALLWYNEHPRMPPEEWYTEHMPPWWQLWLLLVGYDDRNLDGYRPPQSVNRANWRLYPWDCIDPITIEYYRIKIAEDFPWSVVAEAIRKDGRAR